MTESLADWLMVQLAADEQVARDAADEEVANWSKATYVGDRYNYAVVVPVGRDALYRIIECGVEALGGDDLAAHVALWDPARVLADIDAKRQMIAHCRANLDGDEGAEVVADTVLRLLAIPYADRPGYQGEWNL